MVADHLTGIEKFDADLWKLADNLRANSNLASNEYFMPILGLIFLRHATNRYYAAMSGIEEDKAAGKMPDRPLVEADFTRRRALMLPEPARYDVLLEMPKDGNLGAAVTAAMEAVEDHFPPLAGQLPKDYERFEDDVLEEMMRTFDNAGINKARRELEDARADAVEALRQARYFVRQADWLQERFPEAELRDVEGLVKLVDRGEIEAHDWSLTPGRYVGVAPEEEDEDFDFEAALRSIHMDLKELNDEAAKLARRINRNFEELGV